jgi:hypothetical protein
MILIWNYLNTLLVTATFAKNIANRLAGLSSHSVIILILTTALLSILCILMGV